MTTLGRQTLAPAALFVLAVSMLPRAVGSNQTLRRLLYDYVSRTALAPGVRVVNISAPDASGLRRAVVRLGSGPDTYEETLFLTADGREVLLGTLAKLSPDPWRMLRARLNSIAKLYPSKGPAKAPVRIVEFSDLECPYCRAMSGQIAELQRQLPGQVRATFIYFPLEKIHPWARVAADTRGVRRGAEHLWVLALRGRGF